jgi:hypothetical protein
MKKNSNIILRVPDQTRDALHAHAGAAGLTLSDLLRSLADRELAGSALARGLVPVPTGGAPELTRRVLDPQGRAWEIRLHTDGVWPYLHFTGGDLVRMPIEGPTALPAEPLGPALERYRDAGRAEFDWDDPDFRRLCDALHLDPDRIRPKYRARDADVVSGLKRLLIRPHDPVAKPAALLLLRLLRTDRAPVLEDWERVMEAGPLHEARLGHPLLRRAGRRVRPPVTLTRTDGPCAVRSLPSKADVGGQGLFYAGLGHDGTRPGLVAVSLDPRRHKHRVLTDKLRGAGVRFIPESGVPAYMQAEGEAWRDRLLDAPGRIERARRWLRRSLRNRRTLLGIYGARNEIFKPQ